MKILNKQEFSYDVSAITGFTDEVGGELIAKSLVGGTTAKYANVKVGIKGTQVVNVLDSDPVFQAGGCGWTATGTTSFTQIPLTVCPESLQEALCPKDLYDTYQSLLLTSGQPEENVPFVNQIADLKSKQIQQRVEQKLWQATKVGGDCFDGLKTVIDDNAYSTSGATFSSTAAYGTSGNPITEVDKMIAALGDDASAREDLVVWMSFANFRLYVQALTKANFFTNYIGGATVMGTEAIHPNTNIKVVPTIGLAGSGMVVLGPANFIVVGFDLMSDTENMNIWYSKDNNELRIRADYNYGVALVSFYDIVYWVTNGVA
jgi:hypothetical protein